MLGVSLGARLSEGELETEGIPLGRELTVGIGEIVGELVGAEVG